MNVSQGMEMIKRHGLMKFGPRVFLFQFSPQRLLYIEHTSQQLGESLTKR